MQEEVGSVVHMDMQKEQRCVCVCVLAGWFRVCAVGQIYSIYDRSDSHCFSY